MSKTTKPTNNKKEPTLKKTTPPQKGVRMCNFVYKHLYCYCCCLDSFVYKVPEYFSYSTFSYYDLEEEVVDSRLPQPSATH